MINTNDIINKIKSEIVNYTGYENLSEIITNNINIIFLDTDEFLKLSGAKSLSEGPGAFHKRENNTVYMLKKDTYDNHDIHKSIHELLHAYSNNYYNYGKEGFQVSGYVENRLISVGGATNEAATEYLTAIISGDGFRGYPDEMKYIFELLINVLNIKYDFVKIYFQKENWITDEMNKKFNSSKNNQLDEFILEFDNRLLMYRKKDFDFNKMMSILLDAIQDKVINSINIDYESIIRNLYLLRNCGLVDFNQGNLSKIDYITYELEKLYNISYISTNRNNSDNKDDGTIKMTF